jgi:hypothetical protein
LSALPINIPGGVPLDLAKFLSASGAAGAINQFAAGPSAETAIGASGLVNDSGALLTPSSSTPPADATVSLKDGPLAGINNNLVSVDLGLGALSSNTSVTKSGPTRSYKLAGLNLQLGVPLLGTFVNQLSTAIAPVTAANSLTLSAGQLCPLITGTLSVGATTLLEQLDALGLQGLTALLRPIIENPLAPITDVDLCTVNPLLSAVAGFTDAIDDLISVEVTGLGDLTTGLANFSSGGVAVDLTNGTITLDLAGIISAAGVNINSLPPNTNLLEYVTNGLISDKIRNVLDNFVNDLVTNLGKVDVEVTVAGSVLDLGLSDITGPATQALTQALAAAAPAVQQIGAPIDDLLEELVPNLNALVALTANNQSTSKAPTLSAGTVNAGNVSAAAVGDYYRTSALKINVLQNTLNVDLAASEAAVLAADPVSVDGAAAAAAGDDSDAPADNGDGTDSNADTAADSAADAASDGDANADTVADADAQADADVTTTLPSAGAPNLLPFWLLGIALLLFGGAVLVNERRRLSAN